MNVLSKPTSLLHCRNVAEDVMDPARYFQYQRHQNEELNKNTDEYLDESEEKPDSRSSRSTRKRSALLSFLDSDGNVCKVLPEDSLWYMSYVESPNLTAKFHTRFR